ncbi:MAG: SAM-dependent DNA methyltransferase, partial [Kiritimatiellae bacterium]|nr:SAM-dependent DNA methyltransferase [Kiritimatiellia bacterium]
MERLQGEGGTTEADGGNRPLVVASVKMRRELTERTSRLVQFNYAKKVLQGAIAKGGLGFAGIPSQGLFFFHDKDGFFRLSLVTAEVEKRKLKWNAAKRQSFYVEPGAANNIVKRRLFPPIRSFADLKDAFSVEQLTKEFYRKLFDWYSWAMEPSTNVFFPNDIADKTDDRQYNNEAVIRLITRLMFTWFIRQRKLVPDVLFDREGVGGLLKKFDPDSMEQDNYYRAILQNLFFATFNCQPEKRRFMHVFRGKSNERHVTTLYRYEKEFRGGDGGAFKDVMKNVPFLNCALFDCLDKKEREEDGGRELYFDGFSGEKGHSAHLPNGLFFDDERGLVSLFNRYEFTVNENDADDSDVALDPELLGKVFENLLGAFNPETKETARKATGSFYTPREIVDYMVEESLKNYLKGRLGGTTGTEGTAATGEGDAMEPHNGDLDAKIADLFDRTKAAEGETTLFSKKEEAALLDALSDCTLLDPTCGSGAFPMGVLH